MSRKGQPIPGVLRLDIYHRLPEDGTFLCTEGKGGCGCRQPHTVQSTHRVLDGTLEVGEHNLTAITVGGGMVSESIHEVAGFTVIQAEEIL